MSDAIIKVEGLGKKYIISHEQRESYTALRDVITRKARKLAARQKVHTTKEEFWALKDVNFEIKQGEAVGIIGRNGAGKSTLLKILSRITEPSTGRIELNGRVASLLEVGTGFHPELTGRENIFLNGAILGMSQAEIKRKFDEIVDFSGVEKFLDTPVKRYSSGMYVRLAFAVAAHLEPEILVVDEILAVGDAEFQKKCLGKMDEVSKKEGRTVLFVSHNMNVIRNLCSRSLLLGSGKVIGDGNTRDIVEKYFESDSDFGSDVVRSYYHKEGNQHASITNIYVNNEKNAFVSIFERISIRICIEAKEKVEATEMFVIIYNSESLPVLGMFQKDNEELFSLNVNELNIEVSFDNILTPGRYYVSAGIFDSFRQFVDWVEYAETFEVASLYADNRPFAPRLGMIVQKANWRIVN